ncbi:protein-glutamate O-methyltransferase [Gymnodinialimonas sp. 57CJ19]|uniref:CheR family methyltransferase n=1 Tax=Gymnodinialimonas sp. 57CJ19 TaxID=3138498 RepID=UPI0031345B43
MSSDVSAPADPNPSPHSSEDAAFGTIASILQAETGIELTKGKRGLAISRLSRRLRDLGVRDLNAYCDLLSGPKGAAELQEMILLLTTNVTRFFREPHHFDALRSAILPDLMEKARAGAKVRIWSAGCSSGEEAFSLAMTILDAFPEAASWDVRILATDIDRNVIDVGRRGRFRISEEEKLAHPVLEDFTERVTGDNHEVCKVVRSMVQFGCLNLQHPWPMQGKFDVVLCRNVVIYFSQETQQRLWPRFANVMQDGGHLIIGHSERVTGPAVKRFKPAGVTYYELSA